MECSATQRARQSEGLLCGPSAGGRPFTSAAWDTRPWCGRGPYLLFRLLPSVAAKDTAPVHRLSAPSASVRRSNCKAEWTIVSTELITTRSPRGLEILFTPCALQCCFIYISLITSFTATAEYLFFNIRPSILMCSNGSRLFVRPA